MSEIALTRLHRHVKFWHEKYPNKIILTQHINRKLIFRNVDTQQLNKDNLNNYMPSHKSPPKISIQWTKWTENSIEKRIMSLLMESLLITPNIKH